MKITDLANKYGFNVTDLTSFCNSNQSIKVKGAFTPSIDDSEESRVVALYKQKLEDDNNARLAKEEEARKKREAEEKKKVALESMLITTGYNFEGYTIDKYCGYIAGYDMPIAAPVDIVERKIFSMLDTGKKNALEKLKLSAYKLGCNAIIGLNFDYQTFVPNIPPSSHIVVTANGTGVIISKK